MFWIQLEIYISRIFVILFEIYLLLLKQTSTRYLEQINNEKYENINNYNNNQIFFSFSECTSHLKPALYPHIFRELYAITSHFTVIKFFHQPFFLCPAEARAHAIHPYIKKTNGTLTHTPLLK